MPVERLELHAYVYVYVYAYAYVYVFVYVDVYVRACLRMCVCLRAGGAQQFIDEAERSLNDALLIVKRAMVNSKARS